MFGIALNYQIKLIFSFERKVSVGGFIDFKRKKRILNPVKCYKLFSCHLKKDVNIFTLKIILLPFDFVFLRKSRN